MSDVEEDSFQKINVEFADFIRSLKNQGAFYSIYRLIDSFIVITNFFHLENNEYEYFYAKYSNSERTDDDISFKEFRDFLNKITARLELITGNDFDPECLKRARKTKENNSLNETLNVEMADESAPKIHNPKQTFNFPKRDKILQKGFLLPKRLIPKRKIPPISSNNAISEEVIKPNTYTQINKDDQTFNSVIDENNEQQSEGSSSTSTSTLSSPNSTHIISLTPMPETPENYGESRPSLPKDKFVQKPREEIKTSTTLSKAIEKDTD